MAKSTGWDPILIIAQIVALQTLHYVTLSLLIPPLLVMFADPGSLEYEGGAANVGMPVNNTRRADTDRRLARHDPRLAGNGRQADHTRPPWRGSLEGVELGLERGQAGRARIRTARGPQERRPCALLDHRDLLDGSVCGRVRASALAPPLPFRDDAHAPSVYYLYALIRRPRLVLDFSVTLLLVHLVLTTYYAAAIPTSLFFWMIVCASTAGTGVFAEQLCVKREMEEGLVGAPTPDGDDSMEMGSLLRED